MSTSRLERLLTRPWLWLGLLASVGLAAVLVGGSKNGWSDAVWLEVAKGGVQFLGVGVLGGALTLIWRDVSVRRERESERMDKMFAELASMEDLYNQVMTVRRTLRRLGLDRFSDGDEDAVLTPAQVNGFDQQMQILSEMELSFASKKDLLEHTRLLGRAAPGVISCIGQIQKYLHDVLVFWMYEDITEQTRRYVVSEKLAGLLRPKDFRTAMGRPMADISWLISQEAFGPSTSPEYHPKKI